MTPEIGHADVTGAAETDSLASIDALHGKRFSDPQGTQYHFLVGNGHAAADGAIQ
ncbi:MAG: hypothetical protein FJ100_22060, partial [Deltaproteobacteria bacterium]|nr:hypothetical protein [Deltaproteobacteria bacterium]